MYAIRSYYEFHGVGPFNPRTGNGAEREALPTYTEVFESAILGIGRDNP